MMNPVFGNDFLATDANLIFLSKIDKDLKSVIVNIFFNYLSDFKIGVIGWKFQHSTIC